MPPDTQDAHSTDTWGWKSTVSESKALVERFRDISHPLHFPLVLAIGRDLTSVPTSCYDVLACCLLPCVEVPGFDPGFTRSLISSTCSDLRTIIQALFMDKHPSYFWTLMPPITSAGLGDFALRRIKVQASALSHHLVGGSTQTWGTGYRAGFQGLINCGTVHPLHV